MKRREFLYTAAAAPAAITMQGEDRFQSLFNGRTLEGWTVQQGPESAFYVAEGAIVSSDSSRFPAWLRSSRMYENFEFECEFYLDGWIDGGIYLHVPEHGRMNWNGMQIKIFHQVDEVPKPNSMGAVFPRIAPLLVNVKSGGHWNRIRIRMDWPRFEAWVNGERIQDLNLESDPELRYRFRRGYLGLSGLGYPIRFRDLKIRELPATERQEKLFVTDEDFGNWFISESSERLPAEFRPLNGVIRASGLGHLATREVYRDFELSLFVRGPREHNGGILVRSSGEGLSGKSYYEIQLHNVEEAHYCTGSLYYHKRAAYPMIRDEEWFPMLIRLEGPNLLVRINGETTLEYDRLENLAAGHIELQAHQGDSWLEFKEIRLRRL